MDLVKEERISPGILKSDSAAYNPEKIPPSQDDDFKQESNFHNSYTSSLSPRQKSSSPSSGSPPPSHLPQPHSILPDTSVDYGLNNGRTPENSQPITSSMNHIRITSPASSTTNSSPQSILCSPGYPSILSSTATSTSSPQSLLVSDLVKTKAILADRDLSHSILVAGVTKGDLGKELGSIYHGDISDAVTKILEDYDWSQIPLANSDRRKVHVKRPMNAFMVWAQEARRKLSGQHRQVHNAELSKSLGRIWRSMSDGQKKPFIERAEQLRKKHKQEYPDYKYQPRRRKENVKSVSGGKMSPNPNCLNVQDLSAAHSYVGLKGSHLSLGMHPLSPPNSPSTTPSGSRVHDPHLQDHVFVGDGLADTFDAIDRAEMNKYLLPDQNGMMTYAHNVHNAPSSSLAPSSTSCAPNMCSVPPMVVSISGGSSSTSSLHNMVAGNIGSGASLSPSGSCGGTLPSMVTHPRLMTSSSSFPGGSPSPYYANLSSPSHEVSLTRSPPEIPGNEIITSSGSPGGSAGSPEPTADYVELQPSQVPKEEPMSTLSPLKSPVNHFLPQNLCYSQPYPYNYSYAYQMWHG